MPATATLNLEPGTLNSVSPSPPPHVSPSRKLPPTQRDFEIYEAVHVRNCSTWSQAEKHGISQTRVRQIVRRVVEWLGEVIPPQTQVAKEQEVHLARQIAADRFQHQLEEATSLWDETRESKYAGIRIRLTTAQARLGVVGGLIDGLAADAIEGIPVPVYEPADPVEQAVGWDKDAPAAAGPPPDSRNRPSKHRKRLPPAEFCDPIAYKDITPEFIAAAEAAGFPLSPQLIESVEQWRREIAAEHDLLQSQPAPTPDSQLPTPSSSPPLEDCSTSSQQSDNGPIVSPDSSIENPVAPNTCDATLTDQTNAAPAPRNSSQPLLTANDSLPVTELQLTPNQPGATISQIAPADSRLPIPNSLPSLSES